MCFNCLLVTQVIIKCFHVPPAVCLRTPRGTRTPGWESLLYTTKFTIFTHLLFLICHTAWSPVQCS